MVRSVVYYNCLVESIMQYESNVVSRYGAAVDFYEPHPGVHHGPSHLPGVTSPSYGSGDPFSGPTSFPNTTPSMTVGGPALAGEAQQKRDKDAIYG